MKIIVAELLEALHRGGTAEAQFLYISNEGKITLENLKIKIRDVAYVPHLHYLPVGSRVVAVRHTDEVYVVISCSEKPISIEHK